MKGIKEKIVLIHFEALKRPLTVPIPKAEQQLAELDDLWREFLEIRQCSKRQAVRLAAEIFFQASLEYFLIRIRRRAREQRHRRAKLHIIGITENILDGHALQVGNNPAALPQTGSKDGVCQVRFGFLPGRDGEFLRHRAMAEPLICGKMNHIQ